MSYECKMNMFRNTFKNQTHTNYCQDRFLYIFLTFFLKNFLKNFPITSTYKLKNFGEKNSTNISATWYWKPLIFQTYTIWSYRIYTLKDLNSKTCGCKDIGMRKSEFVAKTQFLFICKFEPWHSWSVCLCFLSSLLLVES